MRRLTASIGMLLLTLAASGYGLSGAPQVQAAPPGCLYQSPNWYDPCSGVPPWVQQNGTNWSPVDGRPGMWGPHGYTPVTQQPTPGQCTDYRAACPSS